MAGLRQVRHGTYPSKGRNIILSMTRLRDGVVPPPKYARNCRDAMNCSLSKHNDAAGIHVNHNPPKPAYVNSIESRPYNLLRLLTANWSSATPGQDLFRVKTDWIIWAMAPSPVTLQAVPKESIVI